MTDKKNKQTSVLTERVRTLYMQSPVSNLAALTFSLIFDMMMWDRVGGTTLSYWTLSLFLVLMVRFWLWRQYRLGAQLRSNSAWMRDYTVLSAAIGLIWGAAFVISADIPDTPILVGLMMLYFGITVAAFFAFSVHLPAFFLYTVPSLLAVTYVLRVIGDPVYDLASFALWFFYLYVGFYIRNTHKRVIESFELRQHNSELIGALREEVTQRDEQVEKRTLQLHQANAALQQSEEQLKSVLSGANLGFWDWHYQTGYQEVNDRWLEILGLNRSDIQNDVTDWSDRIHPEDRERMQQLVDKAIRDHTSYAGDFRMRHKDGHWIWILGSGGVVEYDKNGLPKRLCGTHQEISDRKSLERQLEYQASHDALTGLLNRRRLLERLEAEISRAQRHDEQLVLFMLDLDHFKQINDTLGHKAGDRVLQGFATLLDSQLRKMDVSARYGGEEFVIVLPETRLEQAVGMAERLRALVENSDRLAQGFRLSITVSIGIAAYREHGNTAGELIEAADEALYRAKNLGRNRIEVVSAKN